MKKLNMQSVREFLLFRKMLTPVIIQLVFWLGVVVCVIAAINAVIHGHGIIYALETLIFGPIMVRVACELTILIFRIQETLGAIKNELTKGSK